MERLKNILVAVDFSPCSADAVRQAARLGAGANARVTAVNAINLSPFIGAPTLVPGVTIPAIPIEELTRLAHDRWAVFVPDCVERARIRLDVEVGMPRDVILGRVLGDQPDLLVIGAHGVSDRARAMGTTAAACVQRAACPVLVVREGGSQAFQHIVACLDFSNTALPVLGEAIRVTAQEHGALTIMHAYGDPWHGLKRPEEVRDIMPDFDEKFQRAVEDRLRELCAPRAKELDGNLVAYHAELAPSHAEGILSFLTRSKCDLAILGTRGNWSLRDFFWGSTAERVIRTCPCSVLAVKPPGFRQLGAYDTLSDTQSAHSEEAHEVELTRTPVF